MFVFWDDTFIIDENITHPFSCKELGSEVRDGGGVGRGDIKVLGQAQRVGLILVIMVGRVEHYWLHGYCDSW